MPGGEIRYKEAFKLKGGTYSLPAQRAGVAMEENKVRNAPLAVKFNDKVLIAQIDAKPILAELRAALGPLLDPFEDAVLGGQTLTEIGDQEGIGPKGAAGAGKALVFRAMSALDGAWHDIAVRDRKKEREAEAVALRARARIAAKAAAYLGRAA